MNTVSKNHLQLLFLSNRSRVKNGQKGSTRLRLVHWRPKSSSDKACLNVLRAEDVRRVGARLSIKRDDETSIRGDNGADTRRNNKADIERDDKVGI